MFVDGSLLCSERFFSGYSSFSLSSKTNISKFQFDPDFSGQIAYSVEMPLQIPIIINIIISSIIISSIIVNMMTSGRA